MAQITQPPRQSRAGQIVDAAIILILVFLALFIPAELAGAAVDWLPGNFTVEEAADGRRSSPATAAWSSGSVPGNVTFENLT
jgi:hypothetical protein